MSAPVVSVVLTVFDKAAALPATLASLRAQEGGAPSEIVCVDDGSTDGSRALLEAEAARDPRLRVLGDGRNLGPAIRLNQGARAARGRVLQLIDADDLAPPNAQRWALGRLEAQGAEWLHGRRRPGEAALPIPEGAAAERIAAPLRFVAARPVVHMALFVSRALFLAAGGADERVFIQDQSLPLRLAARAGALLWTEATLAVAPGGPGLSANRAQQHHDRFLAALHALEAVGPRDPAAPALARLAASALWKLRRDGFGGGADVALAYALAKLGLPPSRARLEAARARLARLSGVRRPGAAG